MSCTHYQVHIKCASTTTEADIEITILTYNRTIEEIDNLLLDNIP